MRQQFIDARIGEIIQPGENVGEVGDRVDVIREIVTGSLIPDKHEVFSAQAKSVEVRDYGVPPCSLSARFTMVQRGTWWADRIFSTDFSPWRVPR